ncbi:MAG: YggW family oxidoreductase [SAR86 cluster bacterium]|uniref:Heme chaperone HemW n=1 Tax=SAR86 cluster bacterium TaxID=2030880 RepID=A0A2A5CIU1_9GAMM|nr:MAG: YggW family oxidoreductase [SAR86 cluster bacterium]
MNSKSTTSIRATNIRTASPLTLPPLSLYIHIPWCLKKCPYCDFNSHAFEKSFPEQNYIEALLEDLQIDLPYVQGRTLHSIFIGGGTPSLFSPESLAKLLTKIRSFIPFAENMEVTLEANPGTFEQNKFAEFRAGGINRLSIGIQSFQPSFLKKLGRVHSGKEALLAAEIAQQAGFTNFNLDLMFGLPEQTSEQAINDLKQAIQFNPSHISWYQLTIEPNTVFFSKPPVLPPVLAIESMHDEGIALLEDENFKRYEISAFSQAGQQAQHNLNYWQFGDYLGIGAGAHGKISLPHENQILRTRKTRQPQAYLDPNKSYLSESTPISEQDLALEFMMNALRLREGVTMAMLKERTGIDLNEISSILNTLRNQGLIQPDILCTTSKGYNLLNNVLQAFMI